jgi:hypothetical protein
VDLGDRLECDDPTSPGATGYRDLNLAIGGLSAAVSDHARILAVWMPPGDRPALQRTTITEVLNAASDVAGTQPRAGYGFDRARVTDAVVFRGQKGCLSTDAAAVFQFDGDWGFVALFDSTAPRGSMIYPHWDDVLTIAKSTPWPMTDLFPDTACHRLTNRCVPPCLSYPLQPRRGGDRVGIPHAPINLQGGPRIRRADGTRRVTILCSPIGVR